MGRALLVFVFYFLFGALHANTPTIELSSEKKRINCEDHLIYFYKDQDHNITIDDLRSDPTLFQLTEGDRIFESSPEIVWLAFDIKKKSTDSYRNYLIQFGNAHIGHYELFMFNKNGLISKKIQGDNYVYDKREVRYNNFIHNLPDIEEDIINIFIRIDQGGQEVDFPISIYERNHFVQHSLRVKIFHGLFVGLFLITTIVTFSLFFVNKYKYFIHEVVVSLASIMYILSEEGYGMMLFWPNSPYFNGLSRPLFIGIVVVFSLLFTLDFVELGNKKSPFNKISVGAISFYTCFMLFFHPMNILRFRDANNIGYLITFFLFLTLILCVLIALISLWSWVKEKSTDGMVVFFIFFATLISVFVRLLALQGYAWSSNFVQHTGFITRAIHVPLIGGYLIYTAIVIYKRDQDEKIALLEERGRSTQAFIERIDAERQRISMALHDSAGSIITGLRANLQMVKGDYQNISEDNHYKESINLSYRLQEEIRNISNDLLPNSILKLGLPSEIKRLLRDIEKTYKIKTSFEDSENTDFSIDNKIIFHLYYIIREALDNIVKYAEASEILVQYFKYEDEIQLLIEDNGTGFDFEKEKLKSGNGLRNMALRVSWINGSIDIYSEEGTSITINIPLNKKNKVNKE